MARASIAASKVAASVFGTYLSTNMPPARA